MPESRTRDLSASDMPTASWIDRIAPAGARPYLRLARIDRPIGTWLLLLPCWWSVALASPGWPDPALLLLFAVGALVMRGAGCTVNDIADREFDAKVARTASRPLPSGAVSVRQALVFLTLLLAIGLLVLLQFNPFAIAVGAVSLLLVVPYPFMKRITWWPQLWLGLTFNWGALLGWAAVRGDLSLAPVVLYSAGVFWTLGYDTIYAHQDKADDVLIGVKSTALRLGAATRPWLAVFYGLTVALAGVAGGLAGLAWPYFAALAAAAVHFAWQVKRVDIDNPGNCLAVFKSNRDVGLMIFAGAVAGSALA
ncbi:MAG: 4-hydroxybenzoate octaprenyltransferase [Rhodospirillales bacterium]|nr:MAG: 4-hydroxybenzoate octaprenyltransferase [Rhodospirillales bacterium]